MVIENFGQTAWEEVCLERNIDPTGFESFTQYEDSVTTDLIGTICRKFNFEAPVLLDEFGQYWIEYAKNSEYQSMLKNFASSPVDLIESLDSLHSRLQLTFDNLRAPSFWVTRIGDEQILVHYKSDRQMPLAPFVAGLIKGVFKMFDQTCTVEMEEPKNRETAVFKVTYKQEAV